MIPEPEPDGAATLVVLSETDAYFTCPDADIRANSVINSDAIPQYILILKGDKSQQTFFVDIPSSHQSPPSNSYLCSTTRLFQLFLDTGDRIFSRKLQFL